MNTTGISSLYTYCEIYINQQQIRSIYLRTDSNNPAFMEIQLTIYRFVFRFKVCHGQVSMSQVIVRVRVMVFNATFNNISIISWVAVSFICEENHWQTLSHNVVSSTTRYEQDSSSQLVVVIGTDCTGSCKSNYQTMTTTTDIYINFNIHCTCIYRHEGHDVQYNFLKEIHGPIWAEKYFKKREGGGIFILFEVVQ